ncbi:hypothetical protein MRB53_039811 [Persea americana]|nr:hypothetical protein MRB53_039811 [Persea americana]
MPPPASNGRPVSTIHSYSQSADRPNFEKGGQEQQSSLRNELDAIDKGYASGGDLDVQRQRRYPRRGEGSADIGHSRQSSQGSENRLSAFFKRSRPVSEVSKVGEPAPQSPAAVNYYGATRKGEPRIVSEPAMQRAPPIVTKLDDNGMPSARNSAANAAFYKHTSLGSQASVPSMTGPNGFRAVSDAITGKEKALITLPVEDPSPLLLDEKAHDKSVPQSPGRASSSTPSEARIIDPDDLEAGVTKAAAAAAANTAGGAAKRKTKKDTSAYQRGLEKKTPREMMDGCDYCGWMKKRSANLMTTWKPRLFVLRGRRLSYFYSENDTEEKGVIDISNHRVLPANNERITGLHAP